MPREDERLYLPTEKDAIILRELYRASVGAEYGPRPRHQRKALPWRYPFGGFIEFTLLGGLEVSTAAVSVDDWWGRDPGEDEVAVYDHQGLFNGSRIGAKGIAVWDDKRERYVVIECQSKAGYIWGTLGEDMDPTTGATFAVGLNGFKGTQQDVQDPDSTLDVFGIPGISDGLKDGDKVVAMYSSEDDKYYALGKAGGEAEWIEFEVTAYGPPIEGSVTNFWGGTEPASPVDLIDTAGLWERILIAADTYDNEGSKGYATKVGDGEYLITTCQQEASSYRGTVSGSMDPYDVTITDVLDNPQWSQRTDDETVEAYNVFSFDFDGGAIVWIKWNYSQSRYEIIQVECPA